MSKKNKLLPGEAWKTTPESMDLDCILSEEELHSKGKLLAEKQRLLEAKEEAKAAQAAEFTAVIKTIKAEISMLSLQYYQERENRRVACQWQFGIPERYQKTLIRLDTHEVVKIQDCEPHELQGNLFEVVEETETEQEPDDDATGEFNNDEL